MKMKRYFAPDTRQALRALRDEQGPDAVILSNRRVKGGVEIIAAMDYEDSLVNTSLGNPNALGTNKQTGKQTRNRPNRVSARVQSRQQAMPQSRSQSRPQTSTAAQIKTSPVDNNANTTHEVFSDASALNKIQDELAGLRNIMEAPLMQFSWGETDRVQPLYASLLKQLMTLGLSSNLSQTIAKRLVTVGLNNNSWFESLNHLSEMVPVSKEDVLSIGGIVSLLGPTGVGKTTTIAKLAARFALKHGRKGVTLITTDNYRIGAHEQLRSYGRILGIPVHVASDSEELKDILKSTKSDVDRPQLTLIDTAGICQKDVRLTEQITSLDIGGIDIRNYLVLSATGQMNLQDNVIKSFSRINLAGCVVTKIDEAASLGEIISVLIQHDLPISFVCDGQKVPDDLHRARGKLLVKEAIKLMRNLNKSLSSEEMAYAFGGVANHANF